MSQTASDRAAKVVVDREALAELVRLVEQEGWGDSHETREAHQALQDNAYDQLKAIDANVGELVRWAHRFELEGMPVSHLNEPLAAIIKAVQEVRGRE